MTSFCRRVIAMRMIVANKKRIASIFLKPVLFVLTELVPGTWIPIRSPVYGLLMRDKGALEIPVLKSSFANFCKDFLSSRAG